MEKKYRYQLVRIVLIILRNKAFYTTLRKRDWKKQAKKISQIQLQKSELPANSRKQELFPKIRVVKLLVWIL